MKMYINKYKISPDSFGMFSVNAHKNANNNPNPLCQKEITLDQYLTSKYISDPVRLYDASPVCDGAAALILSKHASYSKNKSPRIKITGSASSSEHVGINHRTDVLAAEGIQRSGQKAYKMAGITAKDV